MTMDTRMKRYMILFTAFLFVISIATAHIWPSHAEARFIPKAEAALGGIQIGATVDYVRSIYGEPTKERVLDGHWCGYTLEWTYGETFTIEFANGKVENITVTADNGIKTPAGFAVGQNISGPLAYYGEDTMEYPVKRHQTSYNFYASIGNGLNFMTDKKGKITKIILWFQRS